MNKKTKFTTALIVALSVSLIEPSFADENGKLADNINLEASSKPSIKSSTDKNVINPEISSDNSNLETKSDNQKEAPYEAQSLTPDENLSKDPESQRTVSDQDKSKESYEENSSDSKLADDKDQVKDADAKPETKLDDKKAEEKESVN